MESVKQKLIGFRFIVFVCVAMIVGGYVMLCKWDHELIQLQGLVVTLVTLGGVLIGGKTFTDVLGKK